MEDKLQFACRTPWLWAVAAALGALVALGTGVTRALDGYPLAPHLAGAASAWALMGLGLVLGSFTLGIVILGRRQQRRITLLEDQIALPRSPWSATVVYVPLAALITLRITTLPEQRQVELVWPEGRAVLKQSMLRDPGAFDRLLRLLGERLKALGVPVEDDTAIERARRWRPQFTLAWMMIALTFVASVLGMYSYVYGGYSWDVLMDVGITLTLLVVVPWLVATAPRTARVLAMGFALGFWIEWVAVVTGLSLGWLPPSSTSASMRWYPLTALVQQIASSPSLAWLAEGVRASMAGATLSGVLGAAAFLGTWRLATRCGWLRP